MFSSSARSKPASKTGGLGDKPTQPTDTAAALPASGIVIGKVDSGLIERRKFIRPLPCPEALETSDEASWSQWAKLMAEPHKP